MSLSIHHLVSQPLVDRTNNTNKSWDQIYLCVKDDNNLRDFTCSPYDSFEQADAYFKQNFDLPRTQSTMIQVSRILPKQMIPHILRYKLAKSFINGIVYLRYNDFFKTVIRPKKEYIQIHILFLCNKYYFVATKKIGIPPVATIFIF